MWIIFWVFLTPPSPHVDYRGFFANPPVNHVDSPPLVLEFLKNVLILKKITGRTVKWDAENTVICREMKYFKKFLLKSK